MITNPSILVIAHPHHPFYSELLKHYTVKDPDESLASYQTFDLIFDLTFLPSLNKLFFLKELSKTTRAPIISELTCHFQERFFHEIPHLKASVSTLFYSPKNTYEYYISNRCDSALRPMLENEIQKFYAHSLQTGLSVPFVDITFTMPRIMATVINEAFFALDEELASDQDIELAMIHGVNYPAPLFEWASKIRPPVLIALLRELQDVTLDLRYRPALTLLKLPPQSL